MTSLKANVPKKVALWRQVPDSKVQGANMGPPGACRPQMGPYVGPMNHSIRGGTGFISNILYLIADQFSTQAGDETHNDLKITSIFLITLDISATCLSICAINVVTYGQIDV